MGPSPAVYVSTSQGVQSMIYLGFMLVINSRQGGFVSSRSCLEYPDG